MLQRFNELFAFKVLTKFRTAFAFGSYQDKLYLNVKGYHYKIIS